MSCGDIYMWVYVRDALNVPVHFDPTTIKWFWANCLLVS